MLTVKIINTEIIGYSHCCSYLIQNGDKCYLMNCYIKVELDSFLRLRDIQLQGDFPWKCLTDLRVIN